MVRILAIVGPLIAAFGGFILIIDIARNRVRWWSMVKSPLEAEKIRRNSRAILVKVTEELPERIYSREEKDKIIAEYIEAFDADDLATRENIAEFDFRERKMSWKIALWGFGFIVAGSLMQSLSAFLAV